MSQNETLANILAGISTAAKKFPLAAAGAPVDLANIVAGGFANIVDAARGKQITREVAGGLVPKPVGGSEWLYEKFGMTSKSSGLAEDSAAAALSPLSPGGALKAMFVPAAAIIPSSAIKAAEKMISKRGHMDLAFQKSVYENLGVLVPHADKVPRTIISDNAATINPSRIRQGNDGLEITPGPVEELLIHPELFDNPVIKASGLGKIPIETDFKLTRPQKAYYSPILDEMATHRFLRTEEDVVDAAIHEVQHGIQKRFGMVQGSSPQIIDPNYAANTVIVGEFFQKQAARLSMMENLGIPKADIVAFLKGADTPRSRELASKIFREEYGLYLGERIRALDAQKAAKSAHDSYKHVHGEAEARATQKMRAARLAPTTFPYLDPVFDVDYRLTTR